MLFKVHPHISCIQKTLYCCYVERMETCFIQMNTYFKYTATVYNTRGLLYKMYMTRYIKYTWKRISNTRTRVSCTKNIKLRTYYMAAVQFYIAVTISYKKTQAVFYIRGEVQCVQTVLNTADNFLRFRSVTIYLKTESIALGFLNSLFLPLALFYQKHR